MDADKKQASADSPRWVGLLRGCPPVTEGLPRIFAVFLRSSACPAPFAESAAGIPTKKHNLCLSRVLPRSFRGALSPMSLPRRPLGLRNDAPEPLDLCRISHREPRRQAIAFHTAFLLGCSVCRGFPWEGVRLGTVLPFACCAQKAKKKT